MQIRELPGDEKLLAAVGRIALRHGQLDYALRLIVKATTGQSEKEVLKATSRMGSRELRKSVRNLANEKIGDRQVLKRLESLLSRSRRATDKRNKIIHAVWGHKRDGTPAVLDDDEVREPPPDLDQLDAAAKSLADIADELNEARKNGFLKKAFESIK